MSVHYDTKFGFQCLYEYNFFSDDKLYFLKCLVLYMITILLRSCTETCISTYPLHSDYVLFAVPLLRYFVRL